VDSTPTERRARRSGTRDSTTHQRHETRHRRFRALRTRCGGCKRNATKTTHRKEAHTARVNYAKICTSCFSTTRVLLGVAAGLKRALRPRQQPSVSVIDWCIVGRHAESEYELELSDGRKFRSDLGHVWYHFPDGHRVDPYMESWLDHELERLLNLDRWRVTGPQRSGEKQ
jgi:hypothetical protein